MLPALRRRNHLPAETESDYARQFDALRNDLFRVFDRWPWAAEPGFEDGLTAAYPVDMFEEDGKIVVNAELPGFTKDQVNVAVENGMLNISAERREEKSKGRKHLHERRYERVERRLSLPAGVVDGKASAKLENGVLHLELPKSEEARASKINVS